LRAPRHRPGRDHRRDAPPDQLGHPGSSPSYGMIADRVRQVVDLAPNV